MSVLDLGLGDLDYGGMQLLVYGLLYSIPENEVSGSFVAYKSGQSANTVQLGHLRRYQPFNTPTPPTYFRGQVRTHIDNHPQSPPIPIASKQILPPVQRILTKFERKAQFQRLMACKYTLDIEYERRFRKGMSGLIKEIVEFERDWCMGEGVDPIGVNGLGKVEWKEDVDVEKVKTM
jgi:hypothetical protein